MQSEYMRDNADEATVARHFEAYLLWLFGWVMFCSSQGNSVSKYLLPYAQSLADAAIVEVPQYSLGSAVLSATYLELCRGCLKVLDAKHAGILMGCPLLLQLWSYE